MKIHEYQAKDILAKYGVAVPRGEVANTLDEALEVARRLFINGAKGVVVESKGEKLIVTGDLIHVAAVQFDDPTVTIQFDSDGKAAEAAREKVFAQAAKDGTLIAAAHLQFPGMGHLATNGKGFTFVPVNYMRAK